MDTFTINSIFRSRWKYAVLSLFFIIQENSWAQNSECEQLNVIFCSGFEETPWRDLWNDYDGNPDSTNRVISDPGPHGTEGNHVMRLRVPPGRGGADIVKVLPKSYDKLYARWYEYWEPGYNFLAPNHGGGLFAGERNLLGQAGRRPSGSDFVESWFEHIEGRPNLYTYYRGMYMDCVDPNGSCWGDHFPCFLDSGQGYCTNTAHRPQPGKLPPLLQEGKWYCIEQMIDLGTPTTTAENPDGILNLWIDGVEYGPWTGLWFRTTASLKITLLHIGLFHHDATHSVEGVYLDDVIVSTDPIGCRRESVIVNQTGVKKKQTQVLNVQVTGTKIILPLHKVTKAAISICDVAGNVVYKHQLQTSVVSLNKGNFSAGTYVIKTQMEGLSYFNKVVITH